MKYQQTIKDCKNLGELFDIARLITDKKEATQFFDAYVDFIFKDGKGKNTLVQSVEIAHSNLGYFAGYYSDEVRDHIYEMYGSAHPIFGTTKPTTEEALEAGKKLAKSK